MQQNNAFRNHRLPAVWCVCVLLLFRMKLTHGNNKDAWDEKKAIIDKPTKPNLSIGIRIQTQKKVANNGDNNNNDSQ